MLTVAFGLASALGYAVHDYLLVRIVRSVSVWTALTWVMLVGLAVLLPLALLVDGLPSGDEQWRAAGFAAASGVLEFLGLGALLKGLSTGNLSVVTPLGSLSGGFAAIAVILLGEALPPITWVGLPLAVAGGLMASVERAPDSVLGERSRTRATAGAGWALLSAALFAGTMLFFAEATALPPVSLAAVGRAATCVFVVPVALLTGGLVLPRGYRRRATVAGVVDAGAFVALAVAISLGPVAIASVSVAQAGTWAVVIGLVVLRERLSRVQLAGVVLTCVAITLLAAAGME
ncbi:MAG: EamA family transporter [Deltaproteobacteria bacterium]